MYESKKSEESSDQKPAQRKGMALQKKTNDTGLPDSLKSGIENLSGYSMDDVKVHYNSSKPAQLNAHAYAQGSDIHIASGQEKHLPHEAWHVVQQKQGRVKPTTQVGGVDVNDNVQLEKEADVMGAKAIQMKSKLDSDIECKSVPNSSKIVQRAVGFEFETGWLVGIELSLGTVTPLKKKDRIGYTKFDGFKLEADEAGNDLSEVEFIVDPPVPEGKEGISRLDAIMSDMETFGQVLEAKASSGKPFSLNEVTGNIKDKLFIITPTKDGKLSAGPQVTSGLDLAKIPRLSTIDESLDSLPKILRNDQESAVPKELKGSIDQLQHTASEIDSKEGGLSPELTGVLTLIVNYLSVGGDKHKGEDLDDQTRHALALNYPKRIGDVLLARTNFSKLLSLIPMKEFDGFVDDPDSLVNLVQKVLPNYVDVDDSIIQRGIQKDETGQDLGIEIPDLSIRDWLLGLLRGKDKLSGIKDAESMGEFGMKTEKVGGTSMFSDDPKSVGIFEFRGAQSNKISLQRWKPFALEFLKYISAVHNTI